MDMMLRQFDVDQWAFVSAMGRTVKLDDDTPSYFRSRMDAVVAARKIGVAVNRDGRCYDLNVSI